MKGINPIAAQIANSPAAKLAAKLASSPMAKMAANPMVKAATQMANNPMAQAATRLSRIAQPYAEALQKFSHIEWIGKIPKCWDIVKTKRIFQNNKQVAGKYANDFERLALTMNGVIKRDKDDADGLQPESFEGYQVLEENQLVFKLIDLENVKTSRVGLSPYTGIVSPAYIVLKNTQVDNRFFYYYYMNMYYQEIFNYMGGEGVRSALNAKDLLEVPLPKISMTEQQAIADYLDGECARIDGIVTTQRQIIERLKEYKKSVITEAVTRGLNPNAPMKDSGIEWIGKIPENWEISKVSFFFDIQLGKMVQPNKENEFDIERPYLCAVNFGNNTFKLDTIKTMWFSPAEIELYRVSVGDLFVVEGGDIASSDFVTHPLEDFGFQNALHRVRARASADTRFLRYLLIVAKNMGYIDLICNKATIAHFSKDKFQNMPFLVAPLSEQQAIADYLDKKSAEVDTIIEKRERMIELMTEYKKSLIYECVTGKKEIVDVVE